MDKKLNRSVLRYIMLLCLGFVGLCLPNFVHFDYADGVTTVLWFLSFLYLTNLYPSRRHTLITGAVFLAGYFFKYLGAISFGWAYTLLFLFFALVQYVILLVYSCLIRRWNRFLTTLAFPVLWLTAYFLAMLARLPSLIRIDMMFVDMNVLLQAESLLGSFGLSFVLLWIFSLVSFAIVNRKPAPAVIGVALYIASLMIGMVYLIPNVEESAQVRVAISTGPYVGDYTDYSTLPVEEYLTSMRACVAKAAGEGAEIIAFNEETYEFDDVDEVSFLAECGRTARENDIHILLGLDLKDTDGSEGGKSLNKVIWIDRSGEILGSYLKTKTIPIMEADYARGDGAIPCHTIRAGGRDIKVSYLICYDSNFPLFVSRIEDDTDILFLPSWDWPAVTVMHSKLCRAIAVDNRVSVVKPTYDGISVAVRPDGTIISSSNTNDIGYEQVEIIDVPVRGGTVYTQGLPKKDQHIYGIIAVEIMSMLICLLLLYGNTVASRVKSPRNLQYSCLLIFCMIALVADGTSWILDGCTRVDSALYISTMLSLMMTFALNGVYASYITEYVREQKAVPFILQRAFIVFTTILCVTLVAVAGTGSLFTFKDGVYVEGPLYAGYVIANLICAVLCLTLNMIHMRKMRLSDRLASIPFILLPFCSGVISLFVETFDYVYPATVLSLVELYILIQSERQDKLEKEGSISYYYARHDALTGLTNRLGYDEKLKELSASGHTVGVIFTDLNGLKVTNDTLGHEAGDQLLMMYADLLCRIFNKTEVFRISGDEFTILLENMDEAVIRSRVEEFRRALNEDGIPMASVGLAYGRSRDAVTLIKVAETEMYNEKSEFHRTHPEMTRQH